MQAIILAAGTGNRLGSLTGNRPKAMVRVAGRELILRVMDFLDHPAVTGRIVVTGYMHGLLEDFLARERTDVRVVHNQDYLSGSIRSIAAAIPFIHGDFIILNTDHIYPRRLLDCMIKSQAGLTAVCDFDRPLVADDMKVKLGPNGNLLKIRKTLTDFDCGYIGSTCCRASHFTKYREAVSAVRETEGDAASVEFVLGELAAKNVPVSICNASGIKWLEVDTPRDLKIAEETLLGHPEFLL